MLVKIACGVVGCMARRTRKNRQSLWLPVWFICPNILQLQYRMRTASAVFFLSVKCNIFIGIGAAIPPGFCNDTFCVSFFNPLLCRHNKAIQPGFLFILKGYSPNSVRQRKEKIGYSTNALRHQKVWMPSEWWITSASVFCVSKNFSYFGRIYNLEILAYNVSGIRNMQKKTKTICKALRETGCCRQAGKRKTCVAGHFFATERGGE